MSPKHSVDLPIREDIRRMLDWDIKAQQPAPGGADDILTVENLKMYFPVTRGILKRRVGSVYAVDDVSFQVKRGQTLGIVGESGSGKSTIGNCVMRVCQPTGGSVVFNGQDITRLDKKSLRSLRRELQMITQDPYASLDPRKCIQDILMEGPRVQHMGLSAGEENDLTARLLMLVGLNPEFSDRYPHEFSGGQRQRISIARALAVNPAFIVCDEIVSALDVSIQAQIVGLMQSLQENLGLTYIFIGHDLSVVRHISDQVAVLYLGKIMELTSSDELYAHPLHPYTQALISAAPIPNPTADRKRQRILLKGEIPSPLHPPEGCRFCTRCKYADERCRTETPALTEAGPGHLVACHRVTG